jgi:GNAT superfamily N-acetyltransferase
MVASTPCEDAFFILPEACSRSKQTSRIKAMAVITFQYGVALEETMEFEAVYPASLQMTLPAKRALLKTPGAVVVWMLVDGALAGEAYGIPMAGFAAEMEGAALVQDDPAEALYCFSNTVLPAFQGRGLGEALKSHWLGLAAGHGFLVIYGHARPGASQRLNAKFGAKFLGDFADWYGTGETYRLYRLALGR